MRMLSCYLTLLLLVGCGKGGGKDSDEFRPLENGFGYGVHTKGFTDKTLRADLQYRDSIDGNQLQGGCHQFEK